MNVNMHELKKEKPHYDRTYIILFPLKIRYIYFYYVYSLCEIFYRDIKKMYLFSSNNVNYTINKRYTCMHTPTLTLLCFKILERNAIARARKFLHIKIYLKRSVIFINLYAYSLGH